MSDDINAKVQFPNLKPLRDFLGQEIRKGDVLVHATQERLAAGDKGHALPALAIVEVIGFCSDSIVQQFDVKVLKTVSHYAAFPVGETVRMCAAREADTGDVYWSSQFFMKIPRPEGL